MCLSVEGSYLFPSKLDLEVLRWLLSDAAAEIQLINLAVFIPHRSWTEENFERKLNYSNSQLFTFVVHDELPAKRHAIS